MSSVQKDDKLLLFKELLDTEQEHAGGLCKLSDEIGVTLRTIENWKSRTTWFKGKKAVFAVGKLAGYINNHNDISNYKIWSVFCNSILNDSNQAIEETDANSTNRPVTVAQFSALTGIKEPSVRELCRRGELPCRYIARRWLIDYDAFLETIQ